MKELLQSIKIEAPVVVAWHLLSGVSHWPKWLPTVTAVEAIGPAELEIGACFVVHQPKLRPATWKVTELVPPNRFAWESYSPGVYIRATHELIELSPDNCRLELSFAFYGWLGSLIGLLFGSLTQSYLERECVALKIAAEKRSCAEISQIIPANPDA